MNHGIKLADGTFFAGMAGAIDDRLELTISQEDAAAHMLDLMDYEKTKRIGFYANQLVAEYTGYRFSYMQRDVTAGKVDVWLEKKGE